MELGERGERPDKPRIGKPIVEGVQRRAGWSNQMSLAFERQVFERRSEERSRLSCTLITGFLGSGKTTLVRHILQHRAHLRIAVLVNDYADLDIDSLLLNTSSVNSAFGLPSVSLVNGCACCNVSGTFKEAVNKVVRSRHNFDHLVIETSGLADPVKIAKDLRGMGVQLDVIVTVVDVEALDKVVGLPIALEQLTIADVVLVNKCDLASLGEISDVEELIETETKGSKAVRCSFLRSNIFQAFVSITLKICQQRDFGNKRNGGGLYKEHRTRCTISRNTSLGLNSFCEFLQLCSIADEYCAEHHNQSNVPSERAGEGKRSPVAE